MFSVVNSYALLDCYVEKFIPFIFDALTFQRNMNCLSYEVSKALPCGRQIVHKNKMLYHKPGDYFSFIHIQLLFLGKILTPSEVNGNVAIDFVRAGI